jgi:hypothetical protein
MWKKKLGREEEDFRGKGKGKKWKQTSGSNKWKMKEEYLEKETEKSSGRKLEKKKSKGE